MFYLRVIIYSLGLLTLILLNFLSHWFLNFCQTKPGMPNWQSRFGLAEDSFYLDCCSLEAEICGVFHGMVTSP